MPKLIICCPEYEIAVLMARRFERDAAPDMHGRRHGITYKWMINRTFSVYRTATGSIVVT